MKIAPKVVTVVIFICLSVGAVLTVFASNNDHWPALKGKIVLLMPNVLLLLLKMFRDSR